MMQTIPAPPVATQPQHCNAPVPCQPENASPCPWTGSTWDFDYGELWKAWTAAGRGGSGRVSCSSIESSSSFEDYVVSDVDDNNNESSQYNNNNNLISTSVLTAPATTNNNRARGGQDDTNNNNVLARNPEEEEDVTNNNKPSAEEETKEENRSKNSSPGRTRLLDEDGFIRRAACVCVDETESKVSRRHSCDCWGT